MRTAASPARELSSPEVTGRSSDRSRTKARRINLVGANAYSATGGIQAMNRLLVRELASGGLLRHAFFLWDDAAVITGEGADIAGRGLASFHSRKHASFLRAVATQALRHPGDLWLCTHVNYASVGLAASLGRSAHFGVLLHAAELDTDFTAGKARALRRAGCVLTVSEYTRKKALRHGVGPGRLHVLPNAIEGTLESHAELSPTTGRSTVLFVGRMDERYKGQTELLDAMVLLRRRVPELRLVFIGEGRSLPQWKEQAAQRDLTGAVEFRGRVSEADLDRAYSEAAVFAMPSENEGFGLVYAEAMALGVPCIGSDRDAAGEVIVHGETGLIVPGGNSIALAEAIRTIVISPGLQAAMGGAGLARYRALYTPERYRTRLLARMQAWSEAAD